MTKRFLNEKTLATTARIVQLATELAEVLASVDAITSEILYPMG